MEDKNWAVKYRQFRWILDVPDLPPWTVKQIRMPFSGQSWHIDFFYINEMEPGVCPVQDHSYGMLRLIDAAGTVIKTCKFGFHLTDYVPVANLDYSSSDPVTGRVIIDVTNEEWT